MIWILIYLRYQIPVCKKWRQLGSWLYRGFLKRIKIHILTKSWDIRYTHLQWIMGVRISLTCLRPRCSIKPSPTKHACDLRGLGNDYLAASNSEIMIFFMLMSAFIWASVCWSSAILLGTICQESPYLSLTQPHCSDSGTWESFSQ